MIGLRSLPRFTSGADFNFLGFRMIWTYSLIPTAVNFGEVVSLQAERAFEIVLFVFKERLVFPNTASSWAIDTITCFLEWISLDRLLSQSGICNCLRMGCFVFSVE